MKRYLVQEKGLQDNKQTTIERRLIEAQDLMHLCQILAEKNSVLTMTNELQILSTEIIVCYQCKKELTKGDLAKSKTERREVCGECLWNGY